MRKNSGFTLIELMIVIAIIAIIAAIAIPGLLSSQRASNERNASASLKTLTSASADFRSNDRDGNKINDFWTRDVCGLYGVCPVGSTEMVKLIEISVAGADYFPGDSGTTAPAVNTEAGQSFYSTKSPKAGYWYRTVGSDEDGNAYAQATGGLNWTGSFFNNSKFGFECFPDTRSAGRNYFIVNEGNSIFKRGVTQSYAKPATNAAVSSLSGNTGGVTQYPNDTSLKTDYGKLD
jgi:prepilin-type N-terminal cleavage/methylation domain-containing protein